MGAENDITAITARRALVQGASVGSAAIPEGYNNPAGYDGRSSGVLLQPGQPHDTNPSLLDTSGGQPAGYAYATPPAAPTTEVASPSANPDKDRSSGPSDEIRGGSTGVTNRAERTGQGDRPPGLSLPQGDDRFDFSNPFTSDRSFRAAQSGGYVDEWSEAHRKYFGAGSAWVWDSNSMEYINQNEYHIRNYGGMTAAAWESQQGGAGGGLDIGGDWQQVLNDWTSNQTDKDNASAARFDLLERNLEDARGESNKQMAIMMAMMGGAREREEPASYNPWGGY